MPMHRRFKHQRRSTRFSEDGRMAYVRLRIDRRDYEFARAWAVGMADSFPSGTAEDHLEGYLNMALISHIDELEWIAPPEILELYKQDDSGEEPKNDLDDWIPF